MPTRRWFSPIPAFLLGSVLCLAGASAQTSSGNDYTVGDIAVDVTAGDAIKAR